MEMGSTELSYEELKQEAIGLLKKNPIGVLSTAEENRVTSRQMLLLPQGLTLWCFTATYSRKYKQMKANNKVAISFNNTQIEGVASFRGKPSDEEYAWFLKTWGKLQPHQYELHRELIFNPNTPFQMIEIQPTRIAIFRGLSDDKQLRMDILNPVEQTALSYDTLDFPY
jgi:general stress protein 26